jgi:3-hydroxybutyryl-CoA dehydrogenase
MGAQIGCEYALGGHEVTLVARDTSAVERRVNRAFELVETESLAAAETVAEARRRTAIATRVDEDAPGCELAVESLPESLDIKAELLGRVAGLAPEAILASNTSSIPISTLGEAIGVPERVIGTHYLNPPLLMPTVEVIASAATDPAIVDRLRATLLALGKLPVLVRRDVPGFLWNRLQFALVRECVWLVENGVASAEDVDVVMRDGLARRWRRVGPMRAIALGGVDTWNRSGHNIVPELSTAPELPDLRAVAIMDGDAAGDAATRDAALAADLRRERGL